MASHKRTKRTQFRQDSNRPQMQSEPLEPEMQERYQQLDDANSAASPGMAGVQARRRNNANNPQVASSAHKKETQVRNG
jgi:hypothetical protein